MILAALLAVLLAKPPDNPTPFAVTVLGKTDTTLAVTRGTSLEMLNTLGRITISTWSRSAIRIRSTGDANDPVDIQYRNGIVHLRTQSERGVARPKITIGPGTSVTAQVEVRRSGGPLPRADYDITVPPWMDLDVAGIYSDVMITGAAASVHATAVHGNLTLHGGTGTIALESLEGTVTVDGAQGTLTISSPNNSVAVNNSTGRATITSVNGRISIESSRFNYLDARTYNGSVSYDGSLDEKGSYSLTTFNGRAIINAAGNPSATIEAASAKGQIKTGSRTCAKPSEGSARRTITLGRGAAQVRLQTFDGDIEIKTKSEFIKC